MTTDDVRVANCAECGVEILHPDDHREVKAGGGRVFGEYASLGRVAGHILGRPYCGVCLCRRPPAGRGSGGDPSPWQENAVRCLEGE